MPARSLGSLTVELQAEVSKFRTDLARIEKQINTRTKRWEKRFSQTQRAFVGIFSVAAVTQITRNLSRTSDEVKNLSARVANATRETGDFSKVWKEVGNIAITTGTELKTTVEVFQRLAIARKELNVTNDEMLAFTKTVQQLGTISGASTTALSAGLTQLSQGLSAGVLRAEEFNSLVENIPAVVQAIAKGLNVTQGELRKMVLEGKVLSTDVFAAIQSQSADIAEQFADMPLTIQRAVENLSTAWSLWIADVENDSEVFKTIAEIINSLAFALREFTSVELPIDEEIRKAAEAIDVLASSLETVRKQFGEDSEVFKRYNQRLQDAQAHFLKLTKSYSENAAAAKGTAEETGKLKIELGEIVVVAKGTGDALGGIGWALDEVDKELQESAQILRDWATAGREVVQVGGEIGSKTGGVMGNIQTREANQRLEEARESLKNINEETQKGIDLSREYQITWEEITRDTIRGIRDAWVGFFEDVFHGKGIESISSFLETVKNMFLRIIAEIAAAWVTSGIFKGLAGIGISVPGIAGGVISGGLLGGTTGFGGGVAVTSGGGGAAIAAGGGGAIATGLGGAVPTGAVAGSQGAIFVGEPLGAGGGIGGGGIGSSAPAGTGAGGGAAAAIPYVMIAIAALDILTAKSISIPDQIKNAMAAGVQEIVGGVEIYGNSLQSMTNAASRVVVGIDEMSQEFADFAAQEGFEIKTVEGLGSIISQTEREGMKLVELKGHFESLKTGAELSSEAIVAGMLRGVVSMTALERETMAAAQEFKVMQETTDPVLASILNGVDRLEGGLSAAKSEANSLASAIASIPSIPGGRGGLPGFANGGSFTVRGSPGTDANLVAFRATAGERVTIDHGANSSSVSPDLINRMDRLIGLMEAA